MNYNYIYNPITNRNINVFTDEGISVFNHYLIGSGRKNYHTNKQDLQQRKYMGRKKIIRKKKISPKKKDIIKHPSVNKYIRPKSRNKLLAEYKKSNFYTRRNKYNNYQLRRTNLLGSFFVGLVVFNATIDLSNALETKGNDRKSSDGLRNPLRLEGPGPRINNVKNVTVAIPVDMTNLDLREFSNNSKSLVSVGRNCTLKNPHLWEDKLGGPEVPISPSAITAACTGNSCRTGAAQMHADAKEIPLQTCGTDPDGVSGGPTPALVLSMERAANKPNATKSEKILLEDGRNMRHAVGCDCQQLTNTSRPFFIVANPSNKQHLLDKASMCGDRELVKELNDRVFISWEIAPEACSIMKKDPWYKTLAAILPDKQGALNGKQALEEDYAYDQLRDNIGKCVSAIASLKAVDLDRARALEWNRINRE